MAKRAAFSRSRLVGKWIHAHERDTTEARVFVGPQIELGLSRGRTRYEFNDDGRFTESGPGPTDRTTARSGRATIEGGTLVLKYRDGAERRIRFELSSDGSLHLRR